MLYNVRRGVLHNGYSCRLELYRISIFQIQPMPNLAGFI